MTSLESVITNLRKSQEDIRRLKEKYPEVTVSLNVILKEQKRIIDMLEKLKDELHAYGVKEVI